MLNIFIWYDIVIYNIAILIRIMYSLVSKFTEQGTFIKLNVLNFMYLNFSLRALAYLFIHMTPNFLDCDLKTVEYIQFYI